MTQTSMCLPQEVSGVRPVLDQLANKWAVLILTVLCPEPVRFNDIRRRLGGITHKALADALKRLERNGLVDRVVLSTAPVGVEYRITTLGLSLQAPFEALYAWASEWGGEIVGAQRRYDERLANALPGHWPSPVIAAVVEA